MAFEDFGERTRRGFNSFRATTADMAAFVRRLVPENLREGFSEGFPGGFSVRKLGPEGLITLKQELVAAKPIFAAAGFDLAAVQVELTLSPRLLAYFHVLPDFNRQTAEQVLEANRQGRVINTALSALLRIADWEIVAADQEMPLQTITIDASLMPGVHLSFRDPPQEGEEPDLF